MSLVQIFHISFSDGIKRGIIIYEHSDQFRMMTSDSGFYGTYSYIMDADQPKLYASAQEAFDIGSAQWDVINASKIQTTNEFIKVEELKKMFSQAEIVHI